MADGGSGNAALTPKQGAGALFDVYRAGLKVQYDLCCRANGGAPQDPEIIKLLNTIPQEWVHLYEAEQRIAVFMSSAQIEAEAARRFVEAETLNVKSAAPLKTAFYAQGATPEQRKALLTTLLDDLHFRYEKLRLDRLELERATLRINWIGLGLLAVIILASINLLVVQKPEEAVMYHQFWIIYFGLLGAYFSRSIHFAANANTMDYDVLASDFSWWAICRRLIAGAVGALLLYCLVRGGLVGGALFPNPIFTTLMTNETLFPRSVHPLTMPLLNTDFAKLLVWSTIAGFSERLIPDQFGQLERRADQTSAAA